MNPRPFHRIRTERRIPDYPFKNFRFTLLLSLLILLTIGIVAAADTPSNPALEQAARENNVMMMHNITTAQRMAAAENATTKGLDISKKTGSGMSLMALPVPGGTPDYFGPYPNYAVSQLPSKDGLGNVIAGTGIRKFVDSLPGLGPSGANNLGQYIPIAASDITSYPGDDYYEIALVQYSEKMHSDIAPTVLRGYVQLETPINAATSKHYPLHYPNGSVIRDAMGNQVFGYEKPHYLGPLVIAQKDKPVRFKFHNYLATGTDGNLFIPVDTTAMGAGVGPDGVSMYKENRATIHLHGGATPWISDGTPHQWTTPAGENTPYPEGVSVKNVPDMDGGNEPAGTLTFYYTNQQSARLMFYHDHAYGITRLNVYAGEAAAYLIQDPEEAAMVAAGAIPSDQIPLVIQDKSFVPSAAQITSQDPTWNWGNTSTPWPHTGSLWYPHVYMPNQNPSDPTNTNAMGRWDYGPWFWPPFTGFLNDPISNPYYDPVNAPWEPALMPATPNPSETPEAFVDTPVVNGAAYPYVQVGPHAYRFRILNAANDRTFNLQLYYAGSNAPMWSGTTLLNGNAGEVNVTAAIPGQLGQPVSWPTDNRAGGVPWANRSGPAWVQIGTEGGFMPAPIDVPQQPIGYDLQHNYGGVLNIKTHSLLLMPAQRADVIVDFTGIPDGTKLILYNDAPAPAPGGDTRYDFYTGDPDQTAIGGAPTTSTGYGPNTRTIMQIQINASIPAPATTWNRNTLNTMLPVAYSRTQDKPLVPESAYNTAFGASYPNQYVNLKNTSMTFVPAGQASQITLPIQAKAIIGDFEMDYGRLTALLGTEIRRTPTNIESRVPAGYVDPPTEVLKSTTNSTLIGTLEDGTQIWRITNVDVDLHPVHWHMFNLQVLNRVIWDGTITPPEPSELGWRETINTPPLTDTIVALRPIAANIPWEIPNSIRLLDPTVPQGSAGTFGGVDPTGGQAPVTNMLINFGWEYVYHCHILGHEENDFMRSMAVAVPPKFPPTGLTAGLVANTTNLSWIDDSISETDWTVQKSTTSAGPWNTIAQILSSTGPTKGSTYYHTDSTQNLNGTTFYRILATNVVGDRTVYPNTAGYPTASANSVPSNIAALSVPGPIVKITSNVVSGVAPLTVRFIDQSPTSNIKTWNWSFGDGTWFNTSVVTSRNPLHDYATPGTYIAQESICNALYCNQTQPGISITVNSGQAPIVKFGKNLTSGTAPLGVKFTDQSTSAQSAIDQWNWSFGDGTWFNTTLATLRNPAHEFATPGVYNIQLIACNAQGCNTTAPTQAVTTNAPNPIIVKFAMTPISGIEPLSVRFVDQSTGTGLNSWNWSYGDGIWFNTSVASLRNPTYVYALNGSYPAHLIVCNAQGCNTTAPTQTVTVTATAPPSPIIVKFGMTPPIGNAPLSVRFVDQSSGTGLTSWNWSYGNGVWFNTSVASLRHPTYIYTVPGSYPAQLIACNAQGCNTTAPTKVITVR